MGSVTPSVAVRELGRERCALWPGGWTRCEAFESRPVFPRRREDVDDNGARVTGDERVDGRDVVVLEATPRPAFHPQSRSAKLLPHFRGKLWIDRQSYQWVKVEAQVIDTITWGLFLIRLDPGARIFFEQSLIRNEVWLPHEVLVTGSARIGLFKKLRLREQVTYKNYRRFQTDSRLLSPQ